VRHPHGLASPFQGHFPMFPPLPHESRAEARAFGPGSDAFGSHVHIMHRRVGLYTTQDAQKPLTAMCVPCTSGTWCIWLTTWLRRAFPMRKWPPAFPLTSNREQNPPQASAPRLANNREDQRVYGRRFDRRRLSKASISASRLNWSAMLQTFRLISGEQRERGRFHDDVL
jgi:hypothetical protein